jgi:hypothetical protein
LTSAHSTTTNNNQNNNITIIDDVLHGHSGVLSFFKKGRDILPVLIDKYMNFQLFSDLVIITKKYIFL